MKTLKYKLLYKKCNSVLCALIVMVFLPLPILSQQKTYQWVKHIGSNNWDITGGATISAKNNIYIAGSFRDTLYCLNKKILSNGLEDIFIAKFDNKGNLEDTWKIGGPKNDQAACLSILPNGNVIIGGRITDSIAFEASRINGKGSRLFLACLNTKGRFIWKNEFMYKSSASINLLACSKNGNIYVAGSFSDTLTIDDKNIVSKGKNDVFILKLSSSGTIEKAISFGSDDVELPKSLSVAENGYITISGNFIKPFNVGEINLIPTNGKRTNSFIIHLDNELKPIWGKHLYGDEYSNISALQTDASGNIYAAGNFNLKLHLQDTLLQSNGAVDAFIAKYTPEGTLIWCRNIGTRYFDYANHLNIDNLGGIIITGSIGDTLHVDSLNITPFIQGNIAFVLQISSEGKAIWGDYISGAGSNFSENVILDDAGNLYLYGSFRDYFQKEKEKIFSYGDQDIFLAKYFNCPVSKAEIQGSTSICRETGTELKVKAGFKNIIWNDSIKSNSLYVANPGQYWVSMLDKKGCRYTDTINITLAPVPVFSLGKDTSLFVGDSLLLQAPDDFPYFLWNDQFYTSEYILRAPNSKAGKANCWLMVKDHLGCTYTDTLTANFFMTPSWINLENIKINIFPNPVKDQLNWHIDTFDPCKLIVELTDNNGKTYFSQYIERYFPGQMMRINMNSIPSGMYLFRIKNSALGDKYRSIPVIKQ